MHNHNVPQCEVNIDAERLRGYPQDLKANISLPCKSKNGSVKLVVCCVYHGNMGRAGQHHAKLKTLNKEYNLSKRRLWENMGTFSSQRQVRINVVG